MCEKLGYIYAILLLYIHYVHQQFQQQCILQTYLFISVGWQSVSCEVIEFDVTVVQWYRQCMSVIMGDRQSGKMSNSV